MAAAGSGMSAKNSGKRRMFGAEHDRWGSVVVGRIEYGSRQACLRLGVQGANENALGGGRLAGRGVFADAAKAAGIADILPVGGPVDRAVEMAWIDERFQQQQRITEAVQPITNQATLAQGQHAGGQIRVRWSGRIRKRLMWRSG